MRASLGLLALLVPAYAQYGYDVGTGQPCYSGQPNCFSYGDDDDGGGSTIKEERCPERPVEPEVVGWVFVTGIVLLALAGLAYGSLLFCRRRRATLAPYALHQLLLWVWVVWHWLQFNDLFDALQGPTGRPEQLSGRVTVILTGVMLVYMGPWLSHVGQWRREGYGSFMPLALTVYLIITVALSALTYEASVVIAQHDRDGYCGNNTGHCGGDFTCWKYRSKQVEGEDRCEKWFCYVQAHHDNWAQLQAQLWSSALSQTVGMGGIMMVIIHWFDVWYLQPWGIHPIEPPQVHPSPQ